jgi:hypothetical protein
VIGQSSQLVYWLIIGDSGRRVSLSSPNATDIISTPITFQREKKTHPSQKNKDMTSLSFVFVIIVLDA